MIIVGAGGHTRELFHSFNEDLKNVFFFDNINSIKEINGVPVLNTFDELMEQFHEDNRFILGVGGVKPRSFLYRQMIQAGGIHFLVRPKNLNYDQSNHMIDGVDVFPYTFIGPNVSIGAGTLINTRSSIHHDTAIGQLCDIAPSATLLGGVMIGDYTFIGGGTTILPKISIEKKCYYWCRFSGN